MTRAYHAAISGSAPVFTQTGDCNRTYDDCHPTKGEHGHSPLPVCPDCGYRRWRPDLGYCKLCAEADDQREQAEREAAEGNVQAAETLHAMKTRREPIRHSKAHRERAKARKARAS